MKHLLVPTDFSAESVKAFAHVRNYAELIGKGQVKISLVSVLEDLLPASVTFEFGMTFIDSRGLLDEAEKNAKSKIAELAKSEFSDLAVQTDVIRAVKSVAHELIDYANKNSVDLIVMSTHGRTGFRRLVIGSVTGDLVRETTCPVLVIPAGL